MRKILCMLAAVGLVITGCCGLTPQTSSDSYNASTNNGNSGNSNVITTSPKTCTTEYRQEPYVDQECENIPYQEQVCQDVQFKHFTLCDNPDTPQSEGWLKDWTVYNCGVTNQESQGGTFIADMGCYFKGEKQHYTVTKYLNPGESQMFTFKVQNTKGYDCFMDYLQIPTKQVCNLVTKTRQSCHSVTKYRDVPHQICN